MRKIKLKEYYNQLIESINDQSNVQETRSKLFILLEERLNISRADLISNKEVEVSAELNKKLQNDLQQLNSNVPVQYIINKAHFYGREFYVDKEVLIPRPETEELVHLLLKSNTRDKPKILDIGTGSGCIPITLKLEIPNSQVYAIDISPSALTIAKHNSELLNSPVHFLQVDILNDMPGEKDFDIIVCNPPYVPEKEKVGMQPEVLNYEPHNALFVADNNPLLFYKRVLEISKDLLKQGGFLYFEIHRDYGEEIKELMEKSWFSDVLIHRDINGNDRIAVGYLKKD